MNNNKSPLSEKEIAKNKRIKTAKKWLGIASNTADVLATVASKRPTVLGALSVGLKVLNSYESIKKEESNINYFEDLGWKEIDLSEFSKFAYSIISFSCKPEIIEKRGNQDKNHYIYTIDDIKIGYVDKNDLIRGPFIRDFSEKEKVLHILGKLIWEYIESNNACLYISKGSLHDYRKEISIVQDDLDSNVYKSNIAMEILESTNKFLDKGFNRSLMFWGPPGTGKTSAMKFIAKNINKFTLRINVSDLNNYSDALITAVSMLKPSVLMIDDFDRAYSHEQMLSQLEKLNANIELFMVSVNDKDKMPEAVMRPGRFDELIELVKLDDEILDELIGEDIDVETKKRLKKLPIAYINEFHKRKIVLGSEMAIKSIEELENRRTKFIDNEEECDIENCDDEELYYDSE